MPKKKVVKRKAAERQFVVAAIMTTGGKPYLRAYKDGGWGWSEGKEGGTRFTFASFARLMYTRAGKGIPLDPPVMRDVQ